MHARFLRTFTIFVKSHPPKEKNHVKKAETLMIKKTQLTPSLWVLKSKPFTTGEQKSCLLKNYESFLSTLYT